jgi:hypothetical protein
LKYSPLINAIERRRQLIGEESGKLLENVGRGSGEAQPCATQRKRQPVTVAGLPHGRADGRKIARPGLVALDEFVGLRARKPALLRERGKPLPVLAAGGRQGVDIHLLR